MLILDNVNKGLTDEGGFDIMPYFPLINHGFILITTRLASLQSLSRGIKVNHMNNREAVGLLSEIVGGVLGY